MPTKTKAEVEAIHKEYKEAEADINSWYEAMDEVTDFHVMEMEGGKYETPAVERYMSKADLKKLERFKELNTDPDFHSQLTDHPDWDEFESLENEMLDSVGNAVRRYYLEIEDGYKEAEERHDKAWSAWLDLTDEERGLVGE